MTTSVLGTGISAHNRKNDLSDFAAELEMVEALGVETIEIPLYDMDVVVGGRIRSAQLAALKCACEDRKVVYTVHGPLAINFLDEPYRLPRHFDVLRASLDVTAEIGAVHYVIHSGLIPVQQADGIEAAYARQREWLSKAGDLCRERGIVLCVENLFAGYQGRVHTASCARLAQELELIGHDHVMATLDFGHAYLREGFAGGDLLAEAAALAPYARHLHLHDNFGRQDDIWMFTDGERVAYGHGDLHMPVGWGDIPWASLMERCSFPPGVVFNIELKPRYWHAAQECVGATKALAAKAKVAMQKAA